MPIISSFPDSSEFSGVKYTVKVGTSWDGAAAPFTQIISVPGIIATDVPIVSAKYSSDYSISISEQLSWSKIYKITISNNYITVFAKEQTESELTIQLLVFDQIGESSSTPSVGALIVQDIILPNGETVSGVNLSGLKSDVIVGTELQIWNDNYSEQSIGISDAIVLGSNMFGAEDLSTKPGVEGQLYFKVVE